MQTLKSDIAARSLPVFSLVSVIDLLYVLFS